MSPGLSKNPSTKHKNDGIFYPFCSSVLYCHSYSRHATHDTPSHSSQSSKHSSQSSKRIICAIRLIKLARSSPLSPNLLQKLHLYHQSVQSSFSFTLTITMLMGRIIYRRPQIHSQNFTSIHPSQTSSTSYLLTHKGPVQLIAEFRVVVSHANP